MKRVWYCRPMPLCRAGTVSVATGRPLTLAFDEAAPFRQRIVPYTFAVDPVARAGETLASLLFRRGDVETAAFNVPFMMQGEVSLGESLEFREPARLKPLALVGGIGLASNELRWPRGLQKTSQSNTGMYRSITCYSASKQQDFLRKTTRPIPHKEFLKVPRSNPSRSKQAADAGCYA